MIFDDDTLRMLSMVAVEALGYAQCTYIGIEYVVECHAPHALWQVCECHSSRQFLRVLFGRVATEHHQGCRTSREGVHKAINIHWLIGLLPQLQILAVPAGQSTMACC